MAFNIHVNGVLHCRLRYSQLLGLHEQIKKEYGANVVPSFPPKKIFTLTPVEVEQRREQLEKYMQAVRQDPLLGASELFNCFLRKAQQETQQIPTEEVSLEVGLSNGQKVTVNILTSDQTEDVLEAVASKLDLPDDLVGYFSLFLVRESVDGGLTFVRKLQEFELPFVSITSLRSTEFHILLRKRNDAQAATGGVGLMVSPRARRALRRVQQHTDRILVADFEGNPVTTVMKDAPFTYHNNTNRNGEYLSALLTEHELLAANTLFRKRMGKRWTFQDRASGMLRHYWDMSYDVDVMENRVGLNLLYAQTVSDIERGWILVNKDHHRQLKSLQEKGSKKEFIRLGQTLKYYGYIKFDPCVTDFPEEGCQVMVGAGNNELSFHQVPVTNGAVTSCSSKCDVKLELSFEYLMSKDRLQWVTISSPQAIMMSICLQSMVDELMVKKSGGSLKKMLRKRHNGSIHRSDSQQAVKSPPLLDSPDPNQEQVGKLSTKLSSVSLRGTNASNSTNDVSGNNFHGNYAFEGIGDDDL
ncbi:hypothetical protein NHX12_026011 [Muraenolepis orangiensis]|uniref:Sorting nexin-17 n=1 Tax=Muraenolepis orangiensis TaxID=630683 RepID=A0A9Q0IQD7_9TELE|nr:hypothetical protein NHX12_026011 [Muraenolepis orangiensis]